LKDAEPLLDPPVPLVVELELVPEADADVVPEVDAIFKG
jgi:hypothetical protein